MKILSVAGHLVCTLWSAECLVKSWHLTVTIYFNCVYFHFYHPFQLGSLSLLPSISTGFTFLVTTHFNCVHFPCYHPFQLGSLSLLPSISTGFTFLVTIHFNWVHFPCYHPFQLGSLSLLPPITSLIQVNVNHRVGLLYILDIGER